MKFIYLLAITLFFIKTAKGQSQLQKFIDTGNSVRWETNFNDMLGRDYKKLDIDKSFRGLCDDCYQYSSGKVLFFANASQLFDPTTDKVIGTPSSKTILILFSTKYAYETELELIKKHCLISDIDGSLREKEGAFVAVPIIWAIGSSAQPQLLRGFRVHTN